MEYEKFDIHTSSFSLFFAPHHLPIDTANGIMGCKLGRSRVPKLPDANPVQNRR